MQAANSAAFGTSNASAVATANATTIALAADNGTCISYPVQSYGEALSSVLSDNDTEAAASGIAAGFAQGCCVSTVTALSVVDLIAIDGCTTILGGILLRESPPSAYILSLHSIKWSALPRPCIGPQIHTHLLHTSLPECARLLPEPVHLMHSMSTSFKPNRRDPHCPVGPALLSTTDYTKSLCLPKWQSVWYQPDQMPGSMLLCRGGDLGQTEHNRVCWRR